MSELRQIITDQINRHVAMNETHREWLADDIAMRVENSEVAIQPKLADCESALAKADATNVAQAEEIKRLRRRMVLRPVRGNPLRTNDFAAETTETCRPATSP